MSHPYAFLRCLLIGLALLAFFSVAESAVADDLIVDGGAIFDMIGDINFDNEIVGQDGAGTLNQGGFTNTVNNSLIIGQNTGSSGTYNLSGGNLAVGGPEVIGSAGAGDFFQTGGSHTVANDLILGQDFDGSGSYFLENGSLSVGGIEVIGSAGAGLVTQIGGSHTVANDLILGQDLDSFGGYTLENGILSVGGNEVIGIQGLGSVTQSGGSHIIANDLILGEGPDGLGAYALDNGSLSVGGSEVIGNLGIGGVVQNGGSHTVANDLILGLSGGFGAYFLNDGSLSVGNEVIGAVGAGAFLQEGGSHTVAGNLILAAFPGSTGLYDLSGGALNVGTLFINTGGTFFQNGGTLNYGILNFQGGEFFGDLVNTTLLMGTGFIGGNVTNAGIVKPGNSPGTLSIDGSYTQTAAGTYKVELASATSYGRIDVTGAPGTAALNGAVAPTLLGGYRPMGNQVFSGIITTTGGVTGTFSSIANQQITPTLLWQARYNPFSVDLWVQRNYTNSGLGLNSNQAAVGAMLNGLAGATSGDLNTVLDAIDGLPASANVRDAFKQISPEKAAALPTLAFTGAGFQMRNLAQRVTDLRFGSREAGGRGGLPESFNLNSSRLEGLMLAYNSSSLAGLVTGKRPASPENRWGLYLEPAIILGAQRSSANQTGFNFSMAGFSTGVDYRVRDSLLMGLATGYTKTDADFHGSGGGVQTDTWPLTAYAAYLPQPFYVYGSLGYALNLFNLERDLSFGGLNRTAQSSPVGHQFNAYGEAGYDLKASSLVVTPVISLAYSGLRVDSFTESGAGALNLKVGSQSASSLQTGVGAKIAVPLKRGPITVVPQAYATYRHEFADDSRGLNAGLSQGGNTFNFQTDAVKKDFAVVGANVDIMTDKNFRVALNYNAELGRSDYTAHSLYAGVRWEF